MTHASDDVEGAPDQLSKPTGTNAETIEAVSDGSYGARDKAGQLLKEAGHSVVISPADDKRILRRIDLAILPIILFTYVLQFLDKSTLSYASVFGILEDANLVGDQFSWLGAVVYVAQLVWQPVIAYMLVKFPIGKYVMQMPPQFDRFADVATSQILRNHGVLLGCRSMRHGSCPQLWRPHGNS